MITVTINGQARELPEGLTLSELLRQFTLNEQLVVVERNREIVPREHYDSVKVAAGDSLEIVHFVGGG